MSYIYSFGAGGNSSATTVSGISVKKLEEADDVGTIQKVDKSLSKAIMQARTALKMSQKDLATAINAKPQVIQEYENGKAIPDPGVISKLERKLKTKLPRPGKKSKVAAKEGAAKGKQQTTLTRGGPPKRR